MGIECFDESYSKVLTVSSKILFSDLYNADLSGKDLSNCVFIGCVLDNCDFQGATMESCSFQYCYITEDSKRPLFDPGHADFLEFRHCNFDPDKSFEISAVDDVQKNINQILRLRRNSDDVGMLDEIHAIVPLDEAGVELGEIVACTHLFYYAEWIKLNAFHYYFRFFQRPEAKDILGELYDDLLEFFLSFSADAYLGHDYKKIFDKFYFGADALSSIKEPLLFKVKESMVFDLINRMHSEVPQEQLKGMKCAYLFFGYDRGYTNKYDFDRIFSFLLSDTKELRKKARGITIVMLREFILGPDEKIEITLEEFQSKLEPYLLKVLVSSLSAVRLIGLKIIENGNYSDWEHKNLALKLMDDENEGVRVLAKEVATSYEWL